MALSMLFVFRLLIVNGGQQLGVELARGLRRVFDVVAQIGGDSHKQCGRGEGHCKGLCKKSPLAVCVDGLRGHGWLANDLHDLLTEQLRRNAVIVVQNGAERRHGVARAFGRRRQLQHVGVFHAPAADASGQIVQSCRLSHAPLRQRAAENLPEGRRRVLGILNASPAIDGFFVDDDGCLRLVMRLIGPRLIDACQQRHNQTEHQQGRQALPNASYYIGYINGFAHAFFPYSSTTTVSGVTAFASSLWTI